MDSPLGGVFASAVIQSLSNGGQLRGQLGDQLRDQLWGQLWDQLGDQLWGQLWDQLGGQLRDQLGGQLRGQLWGQLWGQLGDQLRGQLWGQLRGQLRDQLGDQLGDQLRDQLGDQLGDQLWGQLRDQLGDQLGDQLWGQLRDQLGDQLWGQLWGQLRDQLWGQLWDQLWGQLRDQLRDQLGDQLWGQLGFGMSAWWESYWIALYTKALQLGGIPESERLNTLASACRETGWWWPREGVAILTDRPSVLKRDVQNRLHCEDGPALLYRDGYSLYAWHGTRVPADLIETGWDTKRILKETNTEIRRCAIERMGWDKFIAKSDMPLVASVPDPGNHPHTLDLYDLPKGLEDMFEEPARIMLCTNGSPERDSTRHRFGLVVRAVHDDPVDAAAELYDIPTAAYRQLEHRR
ncbi:DUF6745 domain-containing protein [Mycobacteroides abscessus]|uniref:DUF6745 domain-containing protein n=1 Tax=Mycobacteroides abscessus TaxID=36809 RepID=UPI00188EA43F|nr:hypothetical protein [Mycobacteroides abscessus]